MSKTVRLLQRNLGTRIRRATEVLLKRALAILFLYRMRLYVLLLQKGD
jgi:hypothetical protein